jgi:hypothetical protein
MARARLLALLLPLAPALPLGGCGLTPGDLGITGPGTGKAAVASHASDPDTAASADAVNQPPGLPAGFGGGFSPSYAPANVPKMDQTEGNFYGYN